MPPSEASDTDDHDSVHSLPVGSTRTKVSVSVASVSSGHTPHHSYADIARHAAALETQQHGQQQHAVYREQLQFRYSLLILILKEPIHFNSILLEKVYFVIITNNYFILVGKILLAMLKIAFLPMMIISTIQMLTLHSPQFRHSLNQTNLVITVNTRVT